MKNKTQTYNCIFSTPFGDGAVTWQTDPLLTKKIFLPENRLPKTGLVTTKTGLPAEIKNILQLVADYFNGNQIIPPWKMLDLSDLTELQIKVLKTVSKIPMGKVYPYKKIAEKIGSPKAYRFVGTTLAKNKFPIIIPCHRVVKSDYTLGQFGGGTELKKKLIDREVSSNPSR